MSIRKKLTLVIIQNKGSVLLGMKKRGFGAGKWNGFGGKVQTAESVLDAAIRETKEECGLTPIGLVEVGRLDFEFTTKPDEVHEVHIFSCVTHSGEVTETEEMLPKWFKVAEIPFAEMWSDDIFWFPFFLENIKFRGRFLFDAEEKIVEKELVPIPN